MFKNCLAYIGLIFFALLALLGVGLSLAFFEASGAVDVGQAAGAYRPALSGKLQGFLDLAAGIDLDDIRRLVSGLEDAPPPQILVNGTPLATPGTTVIDLPVSQSPSIQRTNLVENLPLPTLVLSPTLPPPPTTTPVPLPTSTSPPSPTFTPTPVPPLEPAVYRSEVLLQSRRFGSALEAFIGANDRLRADSALAGDPNWINEMAAALDEVRAAGIALAEVGPPPGEYGVIDSLLDRVAVEAATLRNNYLLGMSSGEPQHLSAASENFDRIREYMAQAVGEMVNAGWPIE